MTHSPECQAAIDQRNAEIAAWQARWPNHCKSCGGAGGSVDYYDPSPSGVSLGGGHITMFESCPDCYEKGVCPRCGELAWDPEDDEIGGSPCGYCGWAGKDECPAEAECSCWDGTEAY